jgi:integrase
VNEVSRAVSREDSKNGGSIIVHSPQPIKSITIVPLSERAKRELREWIAQTPPQSTSVFGLSLNGNVDTAFHGAKTAAGLDDLTIHDLRHTFATRMIAAGVELAFLARVLGHKSVQTTMRYVNLHEQAAKEVAKKMDRHRTPRPRRKKASAAEAAVN